MYPPVSGNNIYNKQKIKLGWGTPGISPIYYLIYHYIPAHCGVLSDISLVMYNLTLCGVWLELDGTGKPVCECGYTLSYLYHWFSIGSILLWCMSL